jgi:hypothetical protein
MIDINEIYMTPSYSLFRSRTFWTIIAMMIVGAGNAVIPVIPAPYSALVVCVLGVVASYFHLDTGNSTAGSN